MVDLILILVFRQI